MAVAESDTTIWTIRSPALVLSRMGRGRETVGLLGFEDVGHESVQVVGGLEHGAPARTDVLDTTGDAVVGRICVNAEPDQEGTVRGKFHIDSNDPFAALTCHQEVVIVRSK